MPLRIASAVDVATSHVGSSTSTATVTRTRRPLRTLVPHFHPPPCLDTGRRPSCPVSTRLDKAFHRNRSRDPSTASPRTARWVNDLLPSNILVTARTAAAVPNEVDQQGKAGPPQGYPPSSMAPCLRTDSIRLSNVPRGCGGGPPRCG